MTDLPITDSKRKLASQIQKNYDALTAWFRKKSELHPPAFYCSIDLRDSGHKIAPVDSNLFPAGFNNICPDDLRTAPLILREQILKIAAQNQVAQPRRILIIPESHTQNAHYIENLVHLTSLIQESGFEVQLGWYDSLGRGTTEQTVTLTASSQKQLLAHSLMIDPNGMLKTSSFMPDLILLNNDFSSGYPQLLDTVEQPIFPSHHLGWHARKKTDHFRHYNQLAAEFAAIAEIDPWMMQIDTEEVGPVNFNEDQGIELVAQSVDRVLRRTQEEYDRRKISSKPFVFVKNNSGTYGMGIMVIHSSDELRAMNRRSKNKMSVGKNRLPIQSVAVQEGIPTATLVDRLASEPVIYLSGGELIGGFLRTNPDRGPEDNLNSQGMVFRKLCMADLRNAQDELLDSEQPGAIQAPVLELVYGCIAKISALATGYEHQIELL
jgi:glutamate--cysteine ligase